jgi:hypothetical protein
VLPIPDRAHVELTTFDAKDPGTKYPARTQEEGSNGNTEFSGKVTWVEIDLGEAAAELEHLITPEDRLSLAMGIH